MGQYYSEFDYANLRIGFAQSNPNPDFNININTTNQLKTLTWQSTNRKGVTFSAANDTTWQVTFAGIFYENFAFVSQVQLNVTLFSKSQNAFILLTCGTAFYGSSIATVNSNVLDY